LFGQDRLEEALEELLIVESVAPKEPPVHAILGQIYQRMGNIQDALLHLNIAMDLDPKEANSLKVSQLFLWIFHVFYLFSFLLGHHGQFWGTSVRFLE
jgi:tetratricopeptide (TPR) repeat protein